MSLIFGFFQLFLHQNIGSVKFLDFFVVTIDERIIFLFHGLISNFPFIVFKRSIVFYCLPCFILLLILAWCQLRYEVLDISLFKSLQILPGKYIRSNDGVWSSEISGGLVRFNIFLVWFFKHFLIGLNFPNFRKFSIAKILFSPTNSRWLS